MHAVLQYRPTDLVESESEEWQPYWNCGCHREKQLQLKVQDIKRLYFTSQNRRDGKTHFANNIANVKREIERRL